MVLAISSLWSQNLDMKSLSYTLLLDLLKYDVSSQTMKNFGTNDARTFPAPPHLHMLSSYPMCLIPISFVLVFHSDQDRSLSINHRGREPNQPSISRRCQHVIDVIGYKLPKNDRLATSEPSQSTIRRLAAHPFTASRATADGSSSLPLIHFVQPPPIHFDPAAAEKYTSAWFTARNA